MDFAGVKARFNWRPLLTATGIVIAYFSVITGLVKHWWNDENYSHGLIIPFIAGYIVWQELDRPRSPKLAPEFSTGLIIVISGLMLLLIGTLGSELFAQRVSLIVVLAGTAVYFFGRRVLFSLSVPFALLLLAVPIPQIIFNKISFPLQLVATRVTTAGLVFFGIPAEQSGNVIHLVTASGSRVALEVVEACSGIRSLVTLITLGLIFAYFTRGRRSVVGQKYDEILKSPDLWRTVLLMLSMVPVALVTNATRVMLTGIATYYSGQGVLESWWHDAFGWLSFVVAFLLLIVANWALSKIPFLKVSGTELSENEIASLSGNRRVFGDWKIAPLLITLLAAGSISYWLENRTPAPIERLSVAQFPSRVSRAVRMGPDARFDSETERVLGASDYIMRNYIEPPRKFNLYIGFYDAQRTGATYHSPLNCLPGTGWVMSDGSNVEIISSQGRSFTANQYVVQQGNNRQIMIYWYQGRGRTNTSEYSDKLFTVIDSIRTGRTDGSIVRVLTPVYSDTTDSEAREAARRFAGSVYEALPPFIPD